MKTETLSAKLNNIRLAADRLNGMIVYPGQVFSFWHLIGNPGRKQGYLPSRSLVGGELRQEHGGGLCQLAGLIYVLSLKAGLGVLERSAHSRDIYREHERFAPLGSDAAVAYGIKDLRIQNTLPDPIQFKFDVHDDTILACLCSSSPVRIREIEFRRLTDAGMTRTVETYERSGEAGPSRHIATSRYRLKSSPHPT